MKTFLALLSIFSISQGASSLNVRAGQYLGVDGLNFVYDGDRVRGLGSYHVIIRVESVRSISRAQTPPGSITAQTSVTMLGTAMKICKLNNSFGSGDIVRCLAGALSWQV